MKDGSTTMATLQLEAATSGAGGRQEALLPLRKVENNGVLRITVGTLLCIASFRAMFFIDARGWLFFSFCLGALAGLFILAHGLDAHREWNIARRV